MKRINQELEQYLRFFVDHRQKNWPEQLVTVEFAVNNKVYSTTKLFLFMANYSREVQIGINIRKKEKIEKTMKFVEKIKKIQEEAGVVLRRTQKEMKQQVDKKRKMVER